jgi:hypothetical protein
MPATAGTVHSIDHKAAVVKPSAVAFDPTNGNSFSNGGSLVLEMTSSAGGTVEVEFANTVDGQAVAPLTYTFTGAQTRIAGGWPVSRYGSNVTVTASVDTITYIAYQV